MMEKITIQDIAKILIERNGLSKKDASAFVNAMFDIIQQALERDRVVKVKGLGTFKIIDVDARESVNVNTGERVLIEGHDKITFTPDALMKELVNKPFSQFETVVLKDGVDFDDMEKGEPDSEVGEDPAAMPLVDFGDSVNLKSVVSDEGKKSEPAPPTEPTEPAPAAKQVPEEQVAPVADVVEPEPVVDSAPVEETPAEEPDTEVPSEEAVSYDEMDAPSDRRKWLIPLVTCLIGLLVGYIIGNYFPFTQQDSQEPVKKEKPQPVKVVPKSAKPDTVKAEPSMADTVKAILEKPEPEKSEPSRTELSKNEPVKGATKTEASKSATQDLEFSAKYEAMDARVRTGAYRIVGTADVIKAKEGETLLKISRRTLGPDMECYLEVYNGLKGSSVLKAGQEIRIPKLQLKKKKKPQTVNEQGKN